MPKQSLTIGSHKTTLPRVVEIRSLLRFYDEDFIQHVYRSILKRSPDNTGLLYYLERVRAGISRTEIILQVYDSPEVDRKLVFLKGGFKAKASLFFSKIPIVGSVVYLIIFVVRIKPIIQDARALNNHLFRISKAVKKQ